MSPIRAAFVDPGNSCTTNCIGCRRSGGVVMKFLCLVVFDENKLRALSESEKIAIDRESLAYDDKLRESGHFIVAQALQPIQTARTLRVRNRRVSMMDGPFAETKEQVGGFILIEATDMDDALK